MNEGDETAQLRVLVVARHPLRPEDLGLPEMPGVGAVQLIRRPARLETAIDEIEPDVVLVDTSFPEGRGIEAIGTALALAPETRVLALTPDPAPHADVALAIRAGASGYLDVDAEVEEVGAALDAVRQGLSWLPEEDMRRVLAGVADDLEVTAAERRSRLTGILLGLIPLMGLVAALMAFLWRKYLGQIGVRPVDLAVDPASRVVDAIVGMSMLLGIFGPLLFVGSWLDMLRSSRLNRGAVAWLLRKPKTAHVVLSLLVVATTLFLARGPDLLLVLVIGPTVGISIIARSLNASEELPRFLRIDKIRPARALIVAVAAFLAFLLFLSTEALLVGPDLGTHGAGGFLAPRILGFKAQPMLKYDVDIEAEPRQVLYLGGNADLYVLVDPCDDNQVEFVSVGSTRLEVIDEVTCETGADP